MPLFAHVGIGFAAKRIAPKIPIWALLISALGPDIIAIFFIFMPTFKWFHHGLVMVIIWSLIAMGITIFFNMYLNSRIDQEEKQKVTQLIYPTAIIIALLVFSHWVLDFIGWPMSAINPAATGIPLFFNDLLLVGLGVYRTWFGVLTMEIGGLVPGILIYIYCIKKAKNENRE